MQENNQYPEFKVCVRCPTYNHSRYITDAMNGFCMQKTDFPFVCVIMDDASTDGEQEVIRDYLKENFDYPEEAGCFEREEEYARVAYARHNTNQNCFFVVLLLKENHFSTSKPKLPYYSKWRKICEYEALCEGDDWWTDSDKLQRQVSFMDNHPSFSICHTGFQFFSEEANAFSDTHKIARRNQDIENRGQDIILSVLDSNKYRIQPCTVLYRLSFYEACSDTIHKYESQFLMGDTQLWCCLLRMGKGSFFPESTSVYRIHTGSACRPFSIKGRLRFLLSAAEMRIALVSDFGYSKSIARRFRRAYLKALCTYLGFDRNYQPFVPLENRFERTRVEFNRFAAVSRFNELKMTFFYKSLLPFLKSVKRKLSQ